MTYSIRKGYYTIRLFLHGSRTFFTRNVIFRINIGGFFSIYYILKMCNVRVAFTDFSSLVFIRFVSFSINFRCPYYMSFVLLLIFLLPRMILLYFFVAFNFFLLRFISVGFLFLFFFYIVI